MKGGEKYMATRKQTETAKKNIKKRLRISIWKHLSTDFHMFSMSTSPEIMRAKKLVA